jgi:hypothetical protein
MITDIDIAIAEREIRLREELREQDRSWNEARRRVANALAEGLGPHDVGRTGRDLYLEIAGATDLTDREVYTLFMSPEQFGIAA